MRFRAPEGGYIPNPYGRDLGLGYRVRTLPQGRDRWGKKDIMNNQRSSVWIIYRKLPLPQSTDILWDSSQASPDARRFQLSGTAFSEQSAVP